MSTFDQLTIEPGKLQCTNFRGNLTELAELAAIYNGEKRKAPMPEEGQEPKKTLGRAKLQEEKKVLHGNSQEQNNHFPRNHSAAVELHIADRPASDQWLAEREAGKRVLEPGAIIYRHLLGTHQCQICFRSKLRHHDKICQGEHACAFCPIKADSQDELRRHRCKRLFWQPIHWLRDNSHTSLNGRTIDFIVTVKNNVKKWEWIQLSPDDLQDIVFPPVEDYRLSCLLVNPELFNSLII